ncbi:MAG: AI-2E family transporter [Burkholderiales bacterium]
MSVKNPSPATASPAPAGSAPLAIRSQRIALVVIAAGVTIGLLRLGQSFFVPLLLGIFTGYAFRPWVTALARWHIPRSIGAALTMCCVGALVFAALYSLREGAMELTEQLPEAARKVRDVMGAQNNATKPLAQIHRAANELDKAAAEATGVPAPRAAPAATGPGLAVLSAEKLLLGMASGVMNVLLEIGTGGLLAFFLLASGDSFRRKVVSIAGPTLARRRITTELLDEIDTQIQGALMVMLITNLLIAGGVAILFAVMGLERPMMWGTLAGVLHVVPYVGSAVLAAAAGAVGLVQFTEVSQAVTLAVSTLALCTLIGSGLSLALQSNASRMNSVVILTGLLFFGWLWGAWGIILGLPALAVIKAIADRLTSLEWLAKIMAG